MDFPFVGPVFVKWGTLFFHVSLITPGVEAVPPDGFRSTTVWE
jgi:hypothetical protein